MNYTVDLLEDNSWVLKRPNGIKLVSVKLHLEFEEWGYDHAVLLRDFFDKFVDKEKSVHQKTEEI